MTTAISRTAHTGEHFHCGKPATTATRTGRDPFELDCGTNHRPADTVLIWARDVDEAVEFADDFGTVLGDPELAPIPTRAGFLPFVFPLVSAE